MATEEEFGDFNEKTFYDIATPEEVRTHAGGLAGGARGAQHREGRLTTASSPCCLVLKRLFLLSRPAPFRPQMFDWMQGPLQKDSSDSLYNDQPVPNRKGYVMTQPPRG